MKVKCEADCKYVKNGHCTLKEIEIDYGGVGMPPACLDYHDMSWKAWVDEEDYEEYDEDEEDKKGTELRDDIPENFCSSLDCVHNNGCDGCTLDAVPPPSPFGCKFYKIRV